MIVRRIPWRWLLAGLAVFLIAGLAAPFLSADRYGERIREALESSLGRPVKIGTVHFDLFHGPGFSISGVEIGEDPKFGVETFAWVVGSLDARLNLKSLWTGKIEWASLRLNEPHVNLVKLDHWNFEPLLTPKLVSTLPSIEVVGGQINFKFGDTKSIFYIGNVDLDAVARRGGGADWDLQFTGEPARTDRIAPMFRQSLTGKGRWRPDRVDFDLNLAGSALSEVSALIFGRDVGVHGWARSRVKLSGPPDAIQVTGRMELQELHRWDQMPVKGESWPLDFRGRLDMSTQRLEVESTTQGPVPLPITVRYRVSDYLGKPHWVLGLQWDSFPAEPLAAIARNLGAPLPADLKLAGALNGAVTWSEQGELQGQIAFRDTAFNFPGSAPIEFDEATVVFAGDRVSLTSALARTGESHASLGAGYRWSTDELDLNISSESMTIADIRSQAARLPVPLLEALRSGVWKGKLRYRRGPEIAEGWSGQVQLSGAEIPLPGLAEPLRLRNATVRLDGAKLWVDRMTARVGGIDLHGDYRYEPNAIRPHRFRIVLPRADAAELERLLAPSLRRNRGFLARTLGIGKPEIPDWLAKRFMDGTLDIGALTVGSTVATGVRSRVRWNGPEVEFGGVEAKVGNGAAYGRLMVSLVGQLPSYRMDFRLDSIDFEGGKLDAEGTAETSGTGSELLTRIRSDGSFAGRGLEIGRTASGCYRLVWPQLRFTELQLMVGPDLFIGRGATQDDGRLLLQLSSGPKQMRITGPLAQLVVEQPLLP